jgi:hypothetical protein
MQQSVRFTGWLHVCPPSSDAMLHVFARSAFSQLLALRAKKTCTFPVFSSTTGVGSHTAEVFSGKAVVESTRTMNSPQVRPESLLILLTKWWLPGTSLHVCTRSYRMPHCDDKVSTDTS